MASNGLDAPDNVAVRDRGRIPLESGSDEFPAHSITVLSYLS
jgi:hypothetical protein